VLTSDVPTDDPAEERPLPEPTAGPSVPPQRFYAALGRSLKRRWFLALVIGLVLGSAAAAGVWILKPAKFTTFALVRIGCERPEVLPRERVVNDLELYRMTQTALLKSPKVLDGALRRDNIRRLALVAQEVDPVTWLESQLNVEPVRGTELLRVA